MENTPQKVCSENGGTWDERDAHEVPQCQLGCCVLAEQAAFVPLVRCKRLSTLFGVENDYRTDIFSEVECIATAQAQDMGACVYESDFERTCEFTTKGECGAAETIEEINGTNITLSSERKFYKDYLCSAEELATTCARQTTTRCHQQKVYWVDSCGNLENVYSNDKGVSWNSGRVARPEEVCAPNDGSDDSCGNCEYLLGSRCEQWEGLLGIGKPADSDFYCQRTECTDRDGDERINGESWCVYDSGTGDGQDAAGSRHFREICVDGEVRVEPCADFRNEVCLDDSMDTELGAFGTAGCRVNRWQDCTAQLDEEDCGNEDIRDCTWFDEVEGMSIGAGDAAADGGQMFSNPTGGKDDTGAAIGQIAGLASTASSFSGGGSAPASGNVIRSVPITGEVVGDAPITGEVVGDAPITGAVFGLEDDDEDVGETESNREDGICAPNYPPGFEFWSNGSASGTCGQASARCIVTYEEKLLGGKDCVDNCECEDEEWAKDANEICVALGDCGGYVNWQGEYTDDGYMWTVDEDEEKFGSFGSVQTGGGFIGMVVAVITGNYIAPVTGRVTVEGHLSGNDDGDEIMESMSPDDSRVYFRGSGESKWVAYDSVGLIPGVNPKEFDYISSGTSSLNLISDGLVTPQITPLTWAVESSSVTGTLTVRSYADPLKVPPGAQTFSSELGAYDHIENLRSGSTLATDVPAAHSSLPSNSGAARGFEFDADLDGSPAPTAAPAKPSSAPTPPTGVAKLEDPSRRTLSRDTPVWGKGQTLGAGKFTAVSDGTKINIGGQEIPMSKGQTAQVVQTDTGWQTTINNADGTPAYTGPHPSTKPVTVANGELYGSAGAPGSTLSGWLGAGGGTWTDAIVSGVQWAVVAYGLGYMLGGILGFNSDNSNALGAGLAGGAATYKVLATRGLSAGWAGLIGVGVGAAIFVMLYRKEDKKVVTFECLPWQAPSGQSDCEKCNADDLPCSEYRCKSLGQNCGIVNPGTEQEMCVNVRPSDVSPPQIMPFDGELTFGHEYTEVKNSPPGPGFKIIRTNDSDDGCLKAFTPLKFGIVTDEPAQCKIDYNHTTHFDDMRGYFGGNNLYGYNHTERFSLPSAAAFANSSFVLENGKEMTFFIRCKDANGNANEAEYAVRFCIDPSPDNTAPQVKATSILNNGCVAQDQDNADVDFYVNEPADCKWSHEDKSYDNMEEAMVCNNDMYQVNALELFTCRASLTGLSRDTTQFYVRCKDQPRAADVNDRNENRQSYVFNLRGSSGLKMKNLRPNGTIFGAVNPAPVELYAETLFGCDSGQAICYYSTTGADGDYVMFFDTDNVDGIHTQRQDLGAGAHTYYIKCVDSGGNAAINTTTFKLDIDTNAPVIARIYEEDELLKIVTVRESECAYSLEDCDFPISEGTAMPYANSTTHVAEWAEDKTYHIKCRDEFRNEEADCSAIVRPSRNFLGD